MKIHILSKELEVLAIGWEKYGLNHTFSGYTLEQLKALKLTVRNVPRDAEPAGGSCIFTGEPAVERIYVARAY